MLSMPVNKGCVEVDEEATTGTSGHHAHIYWFVQGLLGIQWNGFFGITVELLPIQ